MWSGEILTKVQTTTRPTHVCPELRTKIGKAAQNREKQEWKNVKPKLDNARRLRGIYFIDPDDQDDKETPKHARRKLERPMAAAVPCKRKALISTTKVLAKHEIPSQKIPKISMLYSGIYPQGIAWNLLFRKITKISLQAKVSLR